MNYCKIKKNSDFQKLFKKGKKVFSPYLTLLYCPSDCIRMGVAVTKKHGKAVKRNRIKRLLRAAFAANANSFEKNYSVVLIPKVAEEYTFDGFDKAIKSCIRKINLCEK